MAQSAIMVQGKRTAAWQVASNGNNHELANVNGNNDNPFNIQLQLQRSNSSTVSVSDYVAASEFQPRAMNKSVIVTGEHDACGAYEYEYEAKTKTKTCRHQSVDKGASLQLRRCSCTQHWAKDSPLDTCDATLWNTFYVGQRKMNGQAQPLRVRMPPGADSVIENRNADRSISTDDEYMNSELDHPVSPLLAAETSSRPPDFLSSPSRASVVNASPNVPRSRPRGPDLTDGIGSSSRRTNDSSTCSPPAQDASKRRTDAPPLPTRHDSMVHCARTDQSPAETGAYQPDSFSTWSPLHAARSLPQEAFAIAQTDDARSGQRVLAENKRNLRAESQRERVVYQEPGLAKAMSDASLAHFNNDEEYAQRRKISFAKTSDEASIGTQAHPYLRATLVGFIFDPNVRRIHKLVMIASLFVFVALAAFQVHDRIAWYSQVQGTYNSPSATDSRPVAAVAAVETSPATITFPLVSFCFDNSLSGYNLIAYEQDVQAKLAEDDRKTEAVLNVTDKSQPSALDVLTSCANRIPASLYESVTTAMQGDLRNASKRPLSTLSRYAVSTFLYASAHRKDEILLTCKLDETQCTADHFTYELSDSGVCLAFQPLKITVRKNSELKVSLLIPNYDYLQYIPVSGAKLKVRLDSHTTTSKKSLRNAYQQLATEVISPPVSETVIKVTDSRPADAACKDELAVCHSDCVAQQFTKRCGCHLRLPAANESLTRDTSECNLLMLAKCVQYQTSDLFQYEQIQSYCSDHCAVLRSSCQAKYTVNHSTVSLQPLDTFSATMNWRKLRSTSQQEAQERKAPNARMIQRWARLNILNESCFEALRCLAELLMSVDQNTMSSLRLIQKLQGYVTSSTNDPALSQSLRTSLEDAAQQTHQFITALRGTSYYTAPTIDNDSNGIPTLLQFHVRLTGLFLASRIGEERLQTTVTQFNRIMSNLLTIDVKISEYQSRNIQGYSPSVNTLQNNIGEFRTRISRLLALVNEFDTRAQSLVTLFADVPPTFNRLHPEVRNTSDAQFIVDQLRFYSTAVTIRLSPKEAPVVQSLNISAPLVEAAVTYRYSFSELLCEIGGTLALYFFCGLILIRATDFMVLRIVNSKSKRPRTSQESTRNSSKPSKSSIGATNPTRTSINAQIAAGSVPRPTQPVAYV